MQTVLDILTLRYREVESKSQGKHRIAAIHASSLKAALQSRGRR